MRTVYEIKTLMEKVNDYWIEENPDVGICAWERAAYFRGNMDAYEILGKREYLKYAIKWADRNDWNFYNNENHNTTNADNISCGEVYMDMMEKYDVDGKLNHIVSTMEWTANDSCNDYWWWIDTIYMALNFYNRMGIYLKKTALFKKAYMLFINSKIDRGCWDEAESLWFRDENFLADKAHTMSGKKVFWSRGNGWVFAGLAKTLRTLSDDKGWCPQKFSAEYLEVYLKMAASLKKCQKEDGFWSTSLLEPDEFDMPESSGTALNVLGYLIGINEGILPAEEYLESAYKGFEALTNVAMDEKGKIGWVQVVALKPGPVKKEATNDYAVGTYLCICRELIKYLDSDK